MGNNKKENTNNIPAAKPQPVIILPSKQLDARNFRHYSKVHQFMPPGGDFTLDINLISETYLELVKFEIKTVFIQDSAQGLTLTNDYFLGDCKLEIKRMIGTTEMPLGFLNVSMKKDIIENRHLIWDQSANNQLRFYINTAAFEAWTNGIVFPAFNATVDSIKVLLRFTFCDYPKSLYQFNQNPVLTI